MTRTLDLAIIGGDGIGPEVTAEALKALRAAVSDEVTITETPYALGAEHYLETGEILTDETLAALAQHDAAIVRLARILGHQRAVGVDVLRIVMRDHLLGGREIAHRSHSPNTASIAPRIAVASGSMWPLHIMSIA